MEKFSKFIKKCGFTFSFKRLKRAIILVILFLADSAYSSINPNVGAGITDDVDRNIVEQIEN